MPVQLNDAPYQPPPSPVGDPREVVELTDAPEATLVVRVLDADHGLRVNRAAAALLAMEHRVVHAQERLADPAPFEGPQSSEEKLLHAIFGEGTTPTYPYLDADGVVEQGSVIPRDTRVLYDHATRRAVWFTAQEQGEVVGVVRQTVGLADGVAARIEVTVRADDPLCVGDVLASGDGALGVIEAIEDDGESEPRLSAGRRGPHAIRGETVRVARRVPTARQSALGRARGRYEIVTQMPTMGEVVTAAQLDDLAARGCLALFSDFAGYKLDDVTARSRVFETLTRDARVAHPWSGPRGPVPARVAAGAPRDIFSFFDAPRSLDPSREALARAVALARSCGVELALDGHALRVAPLDDPAAGSSGEVRDDLFAQAVFGPTRDYACACGRYARMKHRGVVCERCGVAVLSSSVRRTRFGHIALGAPVRHPWLGTTWSAVPVLPADLRPDAASELNARYRAVLDERSQRALDALLAHLAERLRETLLGGEPARVDYSGRATALLDDGVPAGRCVAPLALLAALAGPLLVHACEASGLAATLKSAAKLVAADGSLRRALVEHAFATRPVLLGGSRDALAAASVDVGDEPVVRLGPALAERLGVTTGEPVAVHLPLSTDAVREAHWLARAGDRDVLRVVPGLRGEDSWLRQLATDAPAAFTARLAHLAAERAVDGCTWPRAACLVGGYEIADDAGLADLPEPPAFVPPGAESVAGDPWLDRSVDELELSVRTADALSSAGILTVRDLVAKTEEDLLRAKNLGRKSVRELNEMLAAMGLSLGMTV